MTSLQIAATELIDAINIHFSTMPDHLRNVLVPLSLNLAEASMREVRAQQSGAPLPPAPPPPPRGLGLRVIDGGRRG